MWICATGNVTVPGTGVELTPERIALVKAIAICTIDFETFPLFAKFRSRTDGSLYQIPIGAGPSSGERTTS